MAIYRVQRLYSDLYQKQFGVFSKLKGALKKINPIAKAKNAQAAAYLEPELAREAEEAALKSRDKWKKIALGTGIGGTGLGLGGGYLLGNNKKK